MKRGLLIFLFSCFVAMGIPVSTMGDDYSPFGPSREKKVDESSSLEVPVRFADPEDKPNFSVTTNGGTKLKHQWLPFADKSDKSTAYLFLIDVSDFKARTGAISKMMGTVEELLKRAEPHHKAGVSVFAASLKEVAPIGTPHAALIAKMKDVKEGDLATLLYGSMSQAIDALARIDADRKALVLMSDGKAEDPEVTRIDVTQKALANNIVIYSIGYVEKAQDKKDLQGMQLMAAATGGPFAEASIGAHQLQPEFADKFYQYLENGGTVDIDSSKLHGKQSISIAATTESGNRFETSIEHTFAEAPKSDENDGDGNKDDKGDSADKDKAPADGTAKPGDGKMDKPGEPGVDGKADADKSKASDSDSKDGEKAANAGSGSKTGDGETSKKDRTALGLLKDYWWALALGLVVLIIVAVILAKLRKSKNNPDEFVGGDFESSVAPQANLQPTESERGCLETLDEPAARFPIYSTAVRIGRGQDNDIRLSNDSVSKHHAEIQIDRDGVFRINDLNSGNGVFVNGNRVSDSELDDGDVIELGDIRLRLTTRI